MVGEVQEAIRNLLNMEWPHDDDDDDTHGTVITDVNVISQNVTTASTTPSAHAGMLLRRRRRRRRRHLYANNNNNNDDDEDADVLSLTLEIKGAVVARPDYYVTRGEASNDFLGTIATVFDENKLVLQKLVVVGGRLPYHAPLAFQQNNNNNNNN